MADISTNDVTEMIGALSDGTATIEQLSFLFRHRSWSADAPADPWPALRAAVATKVAASAQVSAQRGTFRDVTVAYTRGQISRYEYRVLADAAAASVRAERELLG